MASLVGMDTGATKHTCNHTQKWCWAWSEVKQTWNLKLLFRLVLFFNMYSMYTELILVQWIKWSKSHSLRAIPNSSTFSPSGYLSVAGGESSQISHYACWDEDVPSQIVVELSEIEGHFTPACLLSTQTSNQLLSSLQLLTAQIYLEDVIRRKLKAKMCCSVVVFPDQGTKWRSS